MKARGGGIVMLDSGRGKHRLEKARDQGFLKGVFKNKGGCWGLPRQLLATIGCLGSSKDEGYKGAYTQE